MEETLIEENPSQYNLEKGRNNKKLCIIISIILLLILTKRIILFLYFYDSEEESTKEDFEKEEFTKEDLIININYTPNMLYRYNFTKKIQMKVEGDSIKQDNSLKNMEYFSDLFLIIKEENIEKNKNNSTLKKWYTGYIGILKLYFYNKTNDIPMIYDKKLIELVNMENFEEKNNNIDLNQSIGNITFAKIEFYENGDIKNYYFPKDNNFSLLNMEFLKEDCQFIIPKISSDLYTISINDTLNEIINQDKYKNISNFNQNYNLRNLKEKTDKFKDNNFNKSTLYRINEDNIDYEIEEYLSHSKELQKIDLREKNNCSNCSSQILTHFSTKKLQNEKVNLENSIINKTEYTSINNEGILESVIEIENSLIRNIPPKEKDYSEIKVENDDDIEQNTKKNFTFGIDGVLFDIINQLNLTENVSNNKTIKELFKYFDAFTYEEFNETFYNEYKTEMINNQLMRENNITMDKVVENTS